MYRYIGGTGNVATFNENIGILDGHHVLLLDNDIFEYGTQGYARLRNVGKDPKYRWSNNGLPSGVTSCSPDYLEDIIVYEGSWTADQYKLLTHNCQHFVKWAIDILKYYKP